METSGNVLPNYLNILFTLRSWRTCICRRPGTQGLAPHFDTHDVFVLQIEGAKQWPIDQAPQACPLLGSFQPVFSAERLPKLLHDVSVEAGDLIYMPRGFVHEATATTTSSLHLTIGIYPSQWYDLLVQALTALSYREERIRHALPAGFLDRTKLGPILAEKFKELANLFAQEGRAEEALALLEDGFIRQIPQDPWNNFRQVDAVEAVDVVTMVLKRPNLQCRVLEQAGSVSIQFPGNTIAGGTRLPLCCILLLRLTRLLPCMISQGVLVMRAR